MCLMAVLVCMSLLVNDVLVIIAGRRSDARAKFKPCGLCFVVLKLCMACMSKLAVHVTLSMTL